MRKLSKANLQTIHKTEGTSFHPQQKQTQSLAEGKPITLNLCYTKPNS